MMLDIEMIMIKYLENQSTEYESQMLMDILQKSEVMRLKLNFIATGLNRLHKRSDRLFANKY